MRRTLFALLLALVSASAFAGGTWSNVTVTVMTPWTSEGFSPKGVLVVTLSANVTGGASCGSTGPTLAIVDTSTPGGALTAAVLQAARLTGSTVTIHGTGSCPTNGTVENVSNVVL